MPEGSYTSDELELIALAARDAYAAMSGGEGVPEDLVEITKARLMKALLVSSALEKSIAFRHRAGRSRSS
jgi:hypothetical protein